jgi:hypothetical protein
VSLRDALRQAVARCAPQAVQHATTAVDDATTRATRMQRTGVLRRWDRATSDATPAQLSSCTVNREDLQPSALRCNPDDVEGAWTDADISRFTKRRDRLLRWGWAEPDAEKLAERLVRRDREQDDRVSCTDCKHYRPGRCGNHRRAGLGTVDVGRDLATLLQRCDGFKP